MHNNNIIFGSEVMQYFKAIMSYYTKSSFLYKVKKKLMPVFIKSFLHIG